MKRILALLMLCAILLSALSASATEKRKLIHEDEYGKVYLNTDTLVISKRTWGRPPKEHEYASMWIYREYSDSSVEEDGCISMRELVEIIPGQRQWRVEEVRRKYISYDAESKHLNIDRALDKHFSTWQQAVPGSLYEGIYNEINNAYKREKSWFKIF